MTVIIDGQGGGFGRALIEEIRRIGHTGDILAVGTNASATAAMLKSGATMGATGENAVIVNVARASVIAGPVGIVVANSMLGEMSAKMALAVANSPAKKILIPVQKCNVAIAGVADKALGDFIADAAKMVVNAMK